jgi:hypothetical protein
MNSSNIQSLIGFTKPIKNLYLLVDYNFDSVIKQETNNILANFYYFTNTLDNIPNASLFTQKYFAVVSQQLAITPKCKHFAPRGPWSKDPYFICFYPTRYFGYLWSFALFTRSQTLQLFHHSLLEFIIGNYKILQVKRGKTTSFTCHDMANCCETTGGNNLLMQYVNLTEFNFQVLNFKNFLKNAQNLIFNLKQKIQYNSSKKKLKLFKDKIMRGQLLLTKHLKNDIRFILKIINQKIRKFLKFSRAFFSIQNFFPLCLFLAPLFTHPFRSFHNSLSSICFADAACHYMARMASPSMVQDLLPASALQMQLAITWQGWLRHLWSLDHGRCSLPLHGKVRPWFQGKILQNKKNMRSTTAPRPSFYSSKYLALCFFAVVKLRESSCFTTVCNNLIGVKTVQLPFALILRVKSALLQDPRMVNILDAKNPYLIVSSFFTKLRFLFLKLASYLKYVLDKLFWKWAKKHQKQVSYHYILTKYWIFRRKSMQFYVFEKSKITL